MPFRGRPGKGGARRGAGRKPSPKTVLARLALAELDEEAEKSISFIVAMRDNGKASKSLRVECAKFLIEARFGKAKQMMAVSGGDTPVQIQYVPAQKNPSDSNPGL